MSELQLKQPLCLQHWQSLWPELAGLQGAAALLQQPFNRLVHDSRKVLPGDVFFALSGIQHQGQAFIAQAFERGALLVVTEGELALQQQALGSVLFLPRLRERLGTLLALNSGLSARLIRSQAVTGTNGKSSIAHYLCQLWQQLGERAALVGTLGYGELGQLQPASHTTPDLFRLHQLYADWQQQGIHRVAIEASSHALDQGRLDGLSLAAGIFTNLTRDHLDYHGDLASYAAAKFRLFQRPEAELAVLNLDDPLAPDWLRACRAPVRLTYSLTQAAADLFADEIRFDATGLLARLHYQGEAHLLRVPLMGRFNLSNLLAVLAAMLGEGVALTQLLPLVEKLQAVPGRMQRVSLPEKPLVVVDYAHTPDALEQALLAVRDHCQGRLWCVFGCGGNRDSGKRPLMGAVAARLADQVVVTDDNPRHEDPDLIRYQVLQGAVGAVEVGDRAAAIRHAVQLAAAGDVILLAGKGHEAWQEVAGEKRPFDDAAEALSALQERAVS